jgi:hypothetical protein
MIRNSRVGDGGGGETSNPESNSDETTIIDLTSREEKSNVFLRVLVYLLTPLIYISAFVTAPIRRHYDEWVAKKGPLGSHHTQTGQWLRKTKSWTEIEEYGQGSWREDVNGLGLGDGLRGHGYGTFVTREPTPRDSIRAKGAGTVASWEEGALGVC